MATVYDAAGRAILSKAMISGSNNIPTSTLSKGVYILIFNDKRIKIVK